MGQRTGIQYCDDTVNPTSGCDGCELWNGDDVRICYAGNLHEDRMALALPQLYAKDFKEVRLCPGRMAKAAAWSDLAGKDRPDKPWLNGRPRTIFISDMADAFSLAVPFEYLKSEIIDNVTSAKGRRHIWMWLTKQSKRLVAFDAWLQQQGINWPENLMPGVSITSQPTTARIRDLQRVGSIYAVRWVSAEPLKEGVDLGDLRGIAQVMIGGASEQDEGKAAWPFDLKWAWDLIFQSEWHRSAPFVKQLGAHVVNNGKRIVLKDSHGGDWSEWPERLRRREYPQLREIIHAS